MEPWVRDGNVVETGLARRRFRSSGFFQSDQRESFKTLPSPRAPLVAVTPNFAHLVPGFATHLVEGIATHFTT